jgi:alkanesulfonate monooxygenase SsuD/methylene tetrahydromethanopterin reductase-like flavin-dependent oxidoreductase (luciferase family)
VIGGRSTATVRVVAEHADIWNVPGGDLDDSVGSSETLDRLCHDIGRDPASITRSTTVPVVYDRPGVTRNDVAAAIEAGFRHVVLIAPSPYPDGLARWLADDIIDGFG